MDSAGRIVEVVNTSPAGCEKLTDKSASQSPPKVFTKDSPLFQAMLVP
jgi:hypothetical protein